MLCARLPLYSARLPVRCVLCSALRTMPKLTRKAPMARANPAHQVRRNVRRGITKAASANIHVTYPAPARPRLRLIVRSADIVRMPAGQLAGLEEVYRLFERSRADLQECREHSSELFRDRFNIVRVLNESGVLAKMRELLLAKTPPEPGNA